MMMTEQVITVPVDERTFRREYLELITRSELTPLEYVVLAEIVKIGVVGRRQKKTIRDTTGIGQYSMNNILSNLKQKEYLHHNTIDQTYTSAIEVPERLDKLIFQFQFSK